MTRRQMLLTFVVTLFAAACATTSPSMGGVDSLTKSLTNDLGVTPSQATGGVGSMLNYAQNKLSPDQFDQVAKALPGAQTSMDAAKSLGAATGPITDKTGLESAFAKLGMSPDMVSKFAPMLTQAVTTAAGPSVGSLLGGLF